MQVITRHNIPRAYVKGQHRKRHRIIRPLFEFALPDFIVKADEILEKEMEAMRFRKAVDKQFQA